MTEKQIREARIFIKNYGQYLTEEQRKILDKELLIRDIMVSNLVYHSDYFDMTKKSWYIRIRNLGKEGFDWEQLEALGVKNGLQRVKDLWEEMKNDFQKHATIVYHVGEDGEGNSYNGVRWDDEEE